MEKYTYNELISISRAINSVIERSEEFEYDRYLIYRLYKNLKKATNELQDLEKGLKDMDERYREYSEKVYTLAVEAGGEQESQGRVNTNVEGFDYDMFNEGQKELDNEYKDALERQTKINKENNKFKSDIKVEIKWNKIDLSLFPKKLSFKDMPFHLFDMIEEDIEK